MSASIAINIRELLIIEGQQEILGSNIDFESHRIPFLHKYPNDCCEVASYLFGKVAKLLNPEKDIFIAKGRFKSIDHYWVEVDDLIYDLTADQFDIFSEPIISKSKSLVAPYGKYELCDIDSAFDSWDQISKSKWVHFILENINDENKELALHSQ